MVVGYSLFQRLSSSSSFSQRLKDSMIGQQIPGKIMCGNRVIKMMPGKSKIIRVHP